MTDGPEGHVFKANPGWAVAQFIEGSRDGFVPSTFELEPVLAWRFRPSVAGRCVEPITTKGTNHGDRWVLKRPDGLFEFEPGVLFEEEEAVRQMEDGIALEEQLAREEALKASLASEPEPEPEPELKDHGNVRSIFSKPRKTSRSGGDPEAA